MNSIIKKLPYLFAIVMQQLQKILRSVVVLKMTIK
jgi:hypothetical protein